MSKAIDQAIHTLRFGIAPEIALQALHLKGINLSEESFDRSALAQTLHDHAAQINVKSLKLPVGASLKTIEKVVQKQLSSRDKLEDFCLQLGKELFRAGLCPLGGMHVDTANILRQVAFEIDAIRNVAKKTKPEQLLESLRNVDRRVMTFVEKLSREQESSAPEQQNPKFSRANYWALNQQHIVIAKAIKALERRIVKETSPKAREWLDGHALFTDKDLNVLGRQDKRAIAKLAQLGLVHEARTEQGTVTYAYPHSSVTQDQFEKFFTPAQREHIGVCIFNELKRKYSGKPRALGIAEIRDEGVPMLLDKKRVHTLSAQTGLKPAHMVLALKYFASLGLLVKEGDGYTLSQTGLKAGLGVAVVELLRRTGERRSSSGVSDLVDAFLTQASKSKREQQCPQYTVASTSPGLPKTTIMDDIRIPENSLDTGLVREALRRTTSGGSDQLVIVGGLFSGSAALDRKKVRTWADSLNTGEQTRLGSQFLRETGARTIHVSGRIDNLGAERRAWEQAIRERHVASPSDKRPSESAVRRQLERLNDQKQYTEQQQLAVEIAHWTEFINLVVQPLEIKLGRQLYESDTIERATQISMNELEIIRGISRRIVDKGSLAPAKESIIAEYASYLDFIQKENPEILAQLERVIFNQKEQISSSEVVSRSGVALSMRSAAKADPEYRVTVVPDFNYGKDPRTSPTAAYEGMLRSKRNMGHKYDEMHLLLNTGELIGELSSHGAWIISGGTMQGAPNLRQPALHYRVHSSRAKRDETVRGLPPQSSCVTLSGGVHDGKVTQAITYQIRTPKNLKVLEENKLRNLPRKTWNVYVTSDWQIGSPTDKAEMIVAGLIEAIDRGVDEILINGDIRQGINYLRLPQEAQLVESPLNGIDSQGQYIHELLNPVLDYIRARAEADPNFKVPIINILPGNHETNSQSNKGLQGTWFVQEFAEKIRSYFHGWKNDLKFADAHVVCPEKFIADDGTQVDYPMLYIDRRSDTGFCIQATHYNAIGGKGSSFAPTVSGVARAVHSLGVEDPHIRIESHMHVTGFQVRNGVVCVRTGANATGSAYEEHLLYANAAESNLFIKLDSEEVPEFFVATRAYQETKHDYLLERLHNHGILKGYNSFGEFCRDKRRDVSLKKRGNPTDLRKR